MRKFLVSIPLALLAAACASTGDFGGDTGNSSGAGAPTANESGSTAEAPDWVSDETSDAVSDPISAEAQEGTIEEAWERLTLREQKQAFLVDQHLSTARGLRQELRLEEAERELAYALDIDSDNLEAKRMMAEVGALLGRDPGTIQTVGEELSGEYQLRMQQLVEEARDAYRKANVLLARGDHDGAIVELTLCLDHIRWSPYSPDWQGLDRDASELLATARAQKATTEVGAEQASRRLAHEALKARASAERDRQTAIVQNRLERAIAAFEAQDYDAAIDFADEVLREAPRNEQARDIRETAFRSGRTKVKATYLAAKREQYQLWREEIADLRVPYNDVITLPDEDYWARITELRANRPGIDFSDASSAEEADLQERLNTLRIPGLIINEEESLRAVVAALRTITGLPLVVDPLAEEAAIDEGVVFDFQLNNPLIVGKALNLITEMAGEEVTWVIRHDAVLITTREKARGKLVIVNHDVQDLIFGLTDFLGPRIDRLRLLDELEDDDGGGPFGGIGERPTIIEPDDLATLIQENVSVGSWEDEGISITVEGGNMIVVHTPNVQKRVRKFLEDLRRFTSSLVTIESKFMTVAENFIQEIGVDFRGLDNSGSPFTDLDDVTNGLEDMAGLGLDNSGSGNAAGNSAGPPSSGFFYNDGNDGDFKGRSENLFDNPLGDALSNIGGMTLQYTFLNDLQVSMILRLIEKSSSLELINDQVLSVYNTQRAYVTVVNQKAYIQDFDVEVAQFIAIADPQVNILTEGFVLDVRPTIHHNRKYLTLEIQPTVARVVSLTDFSTTLSGATQAVTFQLPELEVQSVFTTAVVPDGGSILLGGLSRVRNIERRAEVPWFANIPVLGFFFKEEGYSDENESLMIMIRAWITDVKEELAKLD